MAHYRSVLGALAISALLTACSEASSPVDPTSQPSFASGSGGGGGGGGNGGGNGGGGAPAVGKIRTASAAAVCDGGSAIGVTIRKGFQDRAEIVMSITGPAVGPVVAPGNLLYWAFTIVDDASGARLLGFGTGSQFSPVGALVTVSGASMTPGVHSFTFLAQNHEITTLTDFNTLLASPARETCTAHLTVVAN
jgi:hypothetical protein